MIDYKVYSFEKNNFIICLVEDFNYADDSSEIYFMDDFGQIHLFIDSLKKSYIMEEVNKKQNEAFNSIMKAIERYDWYYLELEEELYDDLNEVTMRCIDIKYDS